MKLCSRCNKNPAVIFVSKIEGDKTSSEGLCLACAKELGIAPLDKMLEQMGISDSELDTLSSQMADFAENMDGLSADGNIGQMLQQFSGGDADEGGAATAPIDFLSNMFGQTPNGDTAGGSADEKTDKRRSKKQRPGKKSMLDTYGINLTAKAAMGKVDRVINRGAEIERVIQILNRRSKNNPVILGEPGVGKTAIAEGLACRIFEKNVPPKLFGCQLYLIDFPALVAGTQFRGQFEARLKSLLTEAEEAGNVVLVIDEIHNIVAAGDAEGAMSAANILKPALARGEIQIIGATTLSEYRKHIEKDSALERRFQPVLADEPSVAESIEILKGIRDYYEDYHKVKISNEIIEMACRMSERYITDRFLPDKAIDVIDEAGSRVNLKNIPLYRATVAKQELDKLPDRLQAATDEENYELVAQLKSEQMHLEKEYADNSELAKNAEITADDVAAVIEGWTKIPVHKLTADETQKLKSLETLIHRRVVGQDAAVGAVSRAIRRSRADISGKKRPVSFIFAGPTGVGKTELVKTIAEIMFDSEDALIRVDMSEYMEKHSVSKLIGSPPGYVGYDDAGQLTEKVRRKPYSVILLDEIEKAHPEVFNLFLQILDDGRVADSHGKIINFENTIIIMTTNAGSEFKSSSLGFNSDDTLTLADNVDKSLKQFFKPEFLNRIDEVITFSPLTRAQLGEIVTLMLHDVTDRLAERGVDTEITAAAKEVILDKGYDAKFGARPLGRAIHTLVEDRLAMMSLDGELTDGTTLKVDAENGELTFTAVHM